MGAKSFLETFEGFHAAGDRKKLDVALVKIVKIHNELQTDSVRAKLQKAAGALLDDEALGATRMKAADALGRFNDPAGVWKQLRPHLPSVKEEACGPFPLRVVQAVGAVAPDAAVAALTKLMEKAKDPNVSRYAIQALGKYGWSKRRAKILGTLVAHTSKLRPGGTKGKARGSGEAARQLYAFLRETLVAAMNEITGRKVETPEQWLALYKEHKKKIEKLFLIER
jgi:hypothetical protein